jgi:nucleotide-binding universal stress UspA family protein
MKQKRELIVVGVDGSERSKAALRWAVEEARLRNAEVRVVHAWAVYPALYVDTPIAAADWDDLRASAERFVRKFVAENVPDHEGIEITTLAPQATGTAARTLINTANGADLLVVGSRGLGGFRGLLLGSVSQQVVHHARCPVVIVRAPSVADEQEERDRAPAAAGRA